MAKEENSIIICDSSEQCKPENQPSLASKQEIPTHLADGNHAASSDGRKHRSFDEESKVLKELKKQEQKQRALLKKLFRLRKKPTIEHCSSQYADKLPEKEQKMEKMFEEKNFQENMHCSDSLSLDEVKYHGKHLGECEEKCQILETPISTSRFPNQKRKSKCDLGGRWPYGQYRVSKDRRYSKMLKVCRSPNRETPLISETEGVTRGSQEASMRLTPSPPHTHKSLKSREEQEVGYFLQDRLECMQIHKTNRKRPRLKPLAYLSDEETVAYSDLMDAHIMTQLSYMEKYPERCATSPALSEASEESLEKDDLDLEKGQIGQDLNALHREDHRFSLGAEYDVTNPSDKSFKSPISSDAQTENKWLEGHRDRSPGRSNEPRPSPRKVTKRGQARYGQSSYSQEDHASPSRLKKIQARLNASDSDYTLSPKRPPGETARRVDRERRMKQRQIVKLLKRKNRNYGDLISGVAPYVNAEDLAAVTSSSSEEFRVLGPAEGRPETWRDPESNLDKEKGGERNLEGPPLDCTWYPPPLAQCSPHSSPQAEHESKPMVDSNAQTEQVTESSIDPGTQAECVRTRVTAPSYKRRRLGRRSFSPLGLPVRLDDSQPAKVDIKEETPSNETLKSDSFKTVPLRIRQSSPKPQQASHIERKRNAKSACLSDTQSSGAKRGPPGIGFGSVPRRQLKLSSKETAPGKRACIKSAAREQSRSPSRSRLTSRDFIPSPSKRNPPLERHSPGSETEKREAVTLQYRSNAKSRYIPGKANVVKKPGKRSLSAGVVESRVNSHPQPAARSSEPTPSRPWRRTSAAAPKWNKPTRGTKQPEAADCKSMEAPPQHKPSGFCGQTTEKTAGARLGNEHRKLRLSKSPRRPTFTAGDAVSGRRAASPDQTRPTNLPTSGLTDAAKGSGYSGLIGMNKRISGPNRLGKHSGIGGATVKTRKSSKTFSRCQSIPATRSRNPLFRFFHLPSSLRALTRRGMSVFESMSLPVACIDLRELQTFQSPPQPPPSPVECQGRNVIDVTLTKATRDSTSPARRSLISSDHPADTLSSPISGFKDGEWLSESVNDPSFATCSSQNKTFRTIRSQVKRNGDASSCEATKTAEYTTPPSQRYRGASSELRPASTGSWILRRTDSLPQKTSLSTNPSLDALTRSHVSSTRNSDSGLKALEELGAEDNSSTSVSLAKTSGLEYGNSTALSDTPGDDHEAFDSCTHLSRNKMAYVAHRTIPLLQEEPAPGRGHLTRVHESVQDIRMWVFLLFTGLSFICCLQYHFPDFEMYLKEKFRSVLDLRETYLS